MIEAFAGQTPVLGSAVYVAPTALVLGRVQLGAETSVWYGAVLRGDVGGIVVGARTNLQDLSIVHVSSEHGDTRIGDEVTVGHGAVLHACTIGDRVLVGIGAIILDGAVVDTGAVVGAGAVVPPGQRIPAGMLALGNPARVVRTVSADEQERAIRSAARYVALARRHAALSAGA